MHAGMEGEALSSFMVTVERVDGRCDQKSASVCDGGGSIILQRKVEITEPIIEGIPPERQTGSRR